MQINSGKVEMAGLQSQEPTPRRCPCRTWRERITCGISPNGVWGDQEGVATNYGSIIEWDASEVLSNFTFTLTDDAGGRFAIDASTGEITVADGSQLDYEMNTSHDVAVEVTGRGRRDL